MAEDDQLRTPDGSGGEGAGSQGFTGTVNLQLTDLMQMVCLSRSDLVVRVRTKGDLGTITIQGGRITHAVTRSIEGSPALLEILRWKDGRFEMLPFEDPGVQTVRTSWEHLLLEAVRERDEASCADDSSESEETLANPFKDPFEEEIDHVFSSLVQTAQDSLEEERGAEGEFAALRVRVLIVDDSSFFAKKLQSMLEVDGAIQVASIARNGREALEFLNAHRGSVDCVTLDINMPVMQGDTALKHIMIQHPIPALILSSIEPQSFHKVFEFLQVGAVDFLPKPASGRGDPAYSRRLRTLVKGAASADVSRFRRWRPSKVDPSELNNKAFPDAERMLVILGAEGAYMDWFRLPLASLCRQGLVLGFQKMPDAFVEKFCELIEAKTGQPTLPVGGAETMTPGGFYMGNASRTVVMRLVQDPLSLRMQPLPSAELEWQEGVPLLLEQLAKQAEGRLSVLLLSAAHGLPPELIERLLEYKTLLICSPRDKALCTQLVDSVRDYAYLYPEGVVWTSPENLTEVWLRDVHA